MPEPRVNGRKLRFNWRRYLVDLLQLRTGDTKLRITKQYHARELFATEEQCAQTSAKRTKIFDGTAWVKHKLVKVDGTMVCAECCRVGQKRLLQDEVCTGWNDRAPATAWLALQRARLDNIVNRCESAMTETVKALAKRTRRMNQEQGMQGNIEQEHAQWKAQRATRNQEQDTGQVAKRRKQ